jgi:hypothetical protein
MLCLRALELEQMKLSQCAKGHTPGLRFPTGADIFVFLLWDQHSLLCNGYYRNLTEGKAAGL